MKTHYSSGLIKSCVLFGISVILVNCGPGKPSSGPLANMDSLKTEEMAQQKPLIGAQLCSEHDCIDFKGEDNIDLSNYEKTKSDVEYEYENFKNYLRYENENQTLNSMPTAIKMSAIIDLYGKIEKENANITGVKVNFGLIGDSIVFIFQPVIMMPESPATNYILTLKDSCYVYDAMNKVFRAVPDSIVEALTGEYAKNIMIHNYYRSGFHYMTPDDGTWRADTKAVIFSFQEILWAYNTGSKCSSPNGNYCGDLYLYNGVAIYYYVNMGPRKYKHTIFLTTDVLDKLDPNNSNVALAANLAHLCPPSCDQIYYSTLTK